MRLLCSMQQAALARGWPLASAACRAQAPPPPRTHERTTPPGSGSPVPDAPPRLADCLAHTALGALLDRRHERCPLAQPGRAFQALSAAAQTPRHKPRVQAMMLLQQRLPCSGPASRRSAPHARPSSAHAATCAARARDSYDGSLAERLAGGAVRSSPGSRRVFSRRDACRCMLHATPPACCPPADAGQHLAKQAAAVACATSLLLSTPALAEDSQLVRCVKGGALGTGRECPLALQLQLAAACPPPRQPGVAKPRCCCRLPASTNPEVFNAQKTLVEAWQIVGGWLRLRSAPVRRRRMPCRPHRWRRRARGGGGGQRHGSNRRSPPCPPAATHPQPSFVTVSPVPLPPVLRGCTQASRSWTPSSTATAGTRSCWTTCR